MSLHKNESGVVSGLMVAVIGLSVLVLGLGSFGIWAFVAYQDAQSNLDQKIAIKVAQAKEDQSTRDEAKYLEEAKQPNQTFKAPDDYCGLRFQYPRTWSAYESEKLVNGGNYKAYLNPGIVPNVTDSQQFALRVLIEQRDYDNVLAQYQNLIQTGKLLSSTGSSNGQPYTRLSGDFSSDIRGDAVIYRCRDKTITLRTDAKDTFKDDFSALIRTVTFNS
ncbi:MAG: hypothetical protein H6797_04665 [Candidatus Nomurabacteria bacterium]|nr:MAG: hypothetical protein H6797_04665 [Candidatus Nomurabacteria bacterium]